MVFIMDEDSQPPSIKSTPAVLDTTAYAPPLEDFEEGVASQVRLFILPGSVDTMTLPAEDASYEQWVTATKPLLSIIARGGSVAAATGHIPIHRLGGEMECDAVSHLSYEEELYYQAWHETGRPLRFGNIETQINSVSDDFVNHPSTISHVAILQEVFRIPGLHAGHVAWLAEHRPPAIILARAVAKVRQLEVDLAEPSGNASPLHFGEIQTLEYVLNTISRKENVSEALDRDSKIMASTFEKTVRARISELQGLTTLEAGGGDLKRQRREAD